jgi:hypothetical protein
MQVVQANRSCLQLLDNIRKFVQIVLTSRKCAPFPNNMEACMQMVQAQANAMVE